MLYAVDGGEGWIYYGQVSVEKSIGFVRYRSADLADRREVLQHPLMCRVMVSWPSVGRAIRDGIWNKMGTASLHSELDAPDVSVQWPVGTNLVTVWRVGGKPESDDQVVETYQALVADAAIQNIEVMAVWDAVFHIPGRLKADFGAEPGEWHVAGPVWRTRKVKEEYAKRFPDASWHRLPDDWVPVDR